MNQSFGNKLEIRLFLPGTEGAHNPRRNKAGEKQ
jgi:hypothetical protein